jgi:hypothetical protein
MLEHKAWTESQPIDPGTTPGFPGYRVDSTWHRLNPFHKHKEAQEAAQRQMFYDRAQPQPTQDEKTYKVLAAQLEEWRSRTPVPRAVSGLKAQVDALKMKIDSAAADAKFQNDGGFKLVKCSLDAHMSRANPVERHELEIRFNAFLVHKDRGRLSEECNPFIEARMDRERNAGRDATQANLKLQMQAAKSEAAELTAAQARKDAE